MKVLLVIAALAAVCQADEVLRFNSGSDAKANQPQNVLKPVDNKKPIDNKTPKTTKPKFCNDLDCPAFTVKESTKDYELREYAPSRWVQTSLTGIDYRGAQYTMFMRLFRYISGANAKTQKIAMTVPVIVRIIPGQGPACESNFTMSFYVSGSEDPPAATDPTVKVVTMPTMSAYVHGFGGFASQNDYINAAKTLGDKLEEEKKTFEGSYFYTAGYDAPFKLFRRHNEVWVMTN